MLSIAFAMSISLIPLRCAPRGGHDMFFPGLRPGSKHVGLTDLEDFGTTDCDHAARIWAQATP